MKHLLRPLFYTLITLLLLTGCEYKNCKNCSNQTCIEADDWGYPKLETFAKPNLIVGEESNQSVEWIDSGQVLLGTNQKLVITVDRDSQWTTWFEGDEKFFPRTRYCYFLMDNPAAPEVDKNSSGLPDTAEAYNTYCARSLSLSAIHRYSLPDNYADCRTPCWLKDGFGLYMLATPNNPSPDPTNTSLAVTHHMGDTDHDGYLARTTPALIDSNLRTGDRLYFKIMDRYYEDNAGNYRISLKKGTRSPYTGPFETIANFFIEPALNISKNIFINFAANSDFATLVRAALTLYILALGLSHVMGMEGMKNYNDLVMSTLRFGVIIQLLSPTAWTFFYDHIFVVFLEGTTALATSFANPNSVFDPHNPWYSLDQILERFYSHETQVKIISMLFTNALGFIYIALIEMALLVFIIALVKAFSLLILAYLVITILIALFPIFLTFILFNKTRNLFSEWVQQMIAFSVQQLIVFATIGLFASLITSKMEQLIGYRVCWKTIFTLLPTKGLPLLEELALLDVKFYMPDMREIKDTIEIVDSSGREIMANRYIDFPYLDPSIPAESSRIMRVLHMTPFQNEGVIDFYDALTLMASTVVFLKFMDVVPVIADSLKGGDVGRFQSTSLLPTGNSSGLGMTNQLWETGKDAAFGKRLEGDKLKDSWTERDLSTSPAAAILSAPKKLYDLYHNAQLKKELKKEREEARERLNEMKNTQSLQDPTTQPALDPRDNPTEAAAEAAKKKKPLPQHIQNKKQALEGDYTYLINNRHSADPESIGEMKRRLQGFIGDLRSEGAHDEAMEFQNMLRTL